LSKETPPTWANELRVIRCRDVPPTLKLEPAAVSWKLGATKRSFDLLMASSRLRIGDTGPVAAWVDSVATDGLA